MRSPALMFVACLFVALGIVLPDLIRHEQDIHSDNRYYACLSRYDTFPYPEQEPEIQQPIRYNPCFDIGDVAPIYPPDQARVIAFVLAGLAFLLSINWSGLRPSNAS